MQARRDCRGRGTAGDSAHARAARAAVLPASAAATPRAPPGPDRVHRRRCLHPPLDVLLASDDRSMGSAIAHGPAAALLVRDAGFAELIETTPPRPRRRPGDHLGPRILARPRRPRPIPRRPVRRRSTPRRLGPASPPIPWWWSRSRPGRSLVGASLGESWACDAWSTTSRRSCLAGTDRPQPEAPDSPARSAHTRPRRTCRRAGSRRSRWQRGPP